MEVAILFLTCLSSSSCCCCCCCFHVATDTCSTESDWLCICRVSYFLPVEPHFSVGHLSLQQEAHAPSTSATHNSLHNNNRIWTWQETPLQHLRYVCTHAHKKLVFIPIFHTRFQCVSSGKLHKLSRKHLDVL